MALLRLAIACAVSGLGLSVPAGAEDLVAPPISVARLRCLLDSTVSPPPSPEEYAMVVALHRDMVNAYGGSAVGRSGDQWRIGNSLYDELKNLAEDPTRKRMRELIRLQEQMLRDADAAERAFFDAVALVLVADESEAGQRDAIRDAVERVRLAREGDRLIGSIPLGEPSGAFAGLREAVGRLDIDAPTRAALLRVLAARDAALAPLLRAELSKYQRFAIAAAQAFDQVFGGVLPRLGAAMSEEEGARLTARMQEACREEAEGFLDARRAVRSREDESLNQLCSLLPAEAAVELRLRAAWRRSDTISSLAKTEGRLRDALEVLPAGDAARAEVEAFAARWRTMLPQFLADQVGATRKREDETFLDPTSMILGREWFLSESELESERISESEHELGTILAPLVVAAGGRLGNLQAEQSTSGQCRLLERATMSSWRRELEENAPQRESLTAHIRLVSAIHAEDFLSPDAMVATGRARYGIPNRPDRGEIEDEVIRAGPPSETWTACADAAWRAHAATWEERVESAVPSMIQVRRRLRDFAPPSTALSLLATSADSPPDSRERAQALADALRVRDGAWLAAEAADNALFDALEECAKGESGLVLRAVRLARLQRFIERERSAILEFGPIRRLLDWTEIARGAGLEPAALAQVEAAIVVQAWSYGAGVSAKRRNDFAAVAAADAYLLGLRGSSFNRWPGVDRRSDDRDEAHFARATADMMKAMLDAAESNVSEGDGAGAAARTLLERALLRQLYADWHVDRVALRTAARAAGVANTDGERQGVAQALSNLTIANEAANMRAARILLAADGVGRSSDGTDLFPGGPEAATAVDSERLLQEINRDRGDRRAILELELQAVLGADRWREIAPPDIFELNGIGGRARARESQ